MFIFLNIFIFYPKMENLNYKAFKEIIKAASCLQKKSYYTEDLSKKSFLEMLFLCKENSNLLHCLKYKVLSEAFISIKISKAYLNNQEKLLQFESCSIKNQLEDIHKRDDLKLIDLGYLIIFFNSEIYQGILNRLDFASLRQHQILHNLEEIFYNSYCVEYILSLKSPKEIYESVIYYNTYNIEIHLNIVHILGYSECDINKILYYKKLINLIVEKSFLYTIDENEINIFREKIKNYEIYFALKNIAKKYSLNESIAKTQNVQSNLEFLAIEFKKQFNFCKSFKEKVEIMKQFSVFLSYSKFSESTSEERITVYDKICKFLTFDNNKIFYLNEYIQNIKEIVELFFREESNIFVNDLKSKICELEIISKNKKHDFLKMLTHILNEKMVFTMEYKLYVNRDTKFFKFLNLCKKNLYTKDTQEILDFILKTHKILTIFVDMSHNITNAEYDMFYIEIDKIFKILQKIINLKIKYLIKITFIDELEYHVKKLSTKIFNNRLTTLKYEEGKIYNEKQFLEDNLVICKNYRIANRYLTNILNSAKYCLKINTEEEVHNIFKIISDIFFSRDLFIDKASEIIDTLLKSAYEISCFFKCYKDKITTNLSISKKIEIYKSYKKIIKKGSKIVKIKIPLIKQCIKQRLKDYYDSNIEKCKTDPFFDIKMSWQVFKINKLFYKKKLNYNVPEIESKVFIVDHIQNLKENFYKFLMQKDFDFDIKSFKIRYLEYKKSLVRQIKIEKFVNYVSYQKKPNNIDLYKKSLKYLRFIKYHFTSTSHVDKLQFLIDNALDDYKFTSKLALIKKISLYKDFTKKFVNFADILHNNSELDLENVLKKAILSDDINRKIKNLKLMISNLYYFDKENDSIIDFEQRHKLFSAGNSNNKILNDCLADINSIDILLEYKELCNVIREDINDLIYKNNNIILLIKNIIKYADIESYNMLIQILTEKSFKQLVVDEIIKQNKSYQDLIESEISHLKVLIIDLYFVPNKDIINFINGKIFIDDIFKSVFNLDKILYRDNVCIGFESKNEKIYFKEKIEQIQKYKTPEDFKNYFLLFKSKLQEKLYEYFIKRYKILNVDKFKSSANNIPDNISFIDDFINEYMYFSGLKYNNTIKIQFLKKHEQKYSDDFRLLYPKPDIDMQIDKMYLYTKSLQKNIYNLIYHPPTSIIYTELTNTIFNKISLSLIYNSGCILYGESSTGKTETIKYYCRSIGKPLYVFCCSEQLDINLLQNIILGCKINGWYLCLDECNRLSDNVMSKLSDLITENTNEIKFFMTLNLGYLGRNKLPTTLKALFTEIRVDDPNIDDILEIYFSKEIINLFNDLKRKHSGLPHYNFSLRALNTILFNLGDDNSTTNLLTYYYAIFNTKDKLLLKSFITNLSHYDLFEFGTSNSTGILLYGQSLTGKSTLLKEMIKKRNVNFHFFHKFDEKILYDVIKENQDSELWIIYDMILDSKWIENLNSVLDDNKTLCMKNGELLKIGPNIKFIFETNDISKITPATLTRVFTIYFEHTDNYKQISKYINIDLSNKNIEYSSIIQNVRNLIYTSQKNNVIFLQGEMGIGKRNFFNNLIGKNSKVLYLNCREIHSLKFFEHENIYLEEYEKASEQLKQEIKELYEFGTIQDKKQTMKLFISYNGTDDLQKTNYKARINCNILFIKSRDNRYFNLKENKILEFNINKTEEVTDSLRNLQVTGKYEEKYIPQEIYELYKSGKIKYFECFKIMACTSLTECFVDFFTQDINSLCLNKAIKFFVDCKLNFILLGDRLSGKNWLLKDYKLNIIQVFKQTCDIIYPPNTVTAILTNSLDLLSNKIIKENFTIKLYSCTKFIIDFDEFIKNIDILSDNCQNILKYNFIKNITLKPCKCCIQNEKEILNVMTIDDIKFKRENMTYKMISSNLKISDKYGTNLLSFPNMFKLMDFINTAVKTFKELTKFNKFLLDGQKKIQNFHAISHEKKETLKNNNILRKKYHNELNDKIINIKKIEEEINTEKKFLENKKQENLNFYNQIKQKQEYVKKRLNEGESKLKESANKINMITKKNIAELRSMNNPPKTVHYVINILFNLITSEKELDLSNNFKKKSWSELLVFLKSFDLNSLIDASTANILDINILVDKEKEIKKSSQVCSIIYEWIINKHEYKLIKEELQPLEDEISKLLDDGKIALNVIKENEIKLEILENNLTKYNSECKELNKEYEETKQEMLFLKKEIEKYDLLISKIEEEKNNWIIKEFTLDLIYDNLFDNKVILSKQYTDANYLNTNVKDINFKKIISNIYKFKRNIIISDAINDEEIYKLCKFQTESKDFNIVLLNSTSSLYECIGYKLEKIEQFTVKSTVDIKNMQNTLLKSIVNGDILEIIESKNILDQAREELKKLENLREFYEKLNNVYKILYKKYQLSFKVYNDFLVKNNFMQDSNLSENKLLEKSEKFCLYFDINDIFKYDTNILIITNTEDYVYYLEKNIFFKKIISIGDKNHNYIYKKLLDSGNDLYLIKNIDLFDDAIEDKSNNKFIYISEYNRSKNMLKDCRVLNFKYKFDYERSLNFYKKIFTNENEDLIIFHCQLIKKIYEHNLEKKYTFTVKDLDFVIKHKNNISFEYLKFLVYINKIDKCDYELLFLILREKR